MKIIADNGFDTLRKSVHLFTDLTICLINDDERIDFNFCDSEGCWTQSYYVVGNKDKIESVYKLYDEIITELKNKDYIELSSLHIEGIESSFAWFPFELPEELIANNEDKESNEV